MIIRLLNLSNRMCENFGPFVIPAEHIIKKTQYSYVFTDIKPVVHGHLLVSPLRRVQFFEDLTDAEKRDFAALAREAGNVMKRHMGTSALSMTIQNGPLAGQTVPHLHLHVIPRDLPTEWLHVPKLDADAQAELTAVYREFFAADGAL